MNIHKSEVPINEADGWRSYLLEKNIDLNKVGGLIPISNSIRRSASRRQRSLLPAAL